MLDFGYYNMDCLDGMKEFPDNYFDLAIADPPYGSGGTVKTLNKESGLVVGLTVTNRGGITLSERERKTAPIRTGGTWAEKYGKK